MTSSKARNDRHDRHNRHFKYEQFDGSNTCSEQYFMRDPEKHQLQMSASGSSLTTEWMNSVEAANFLRISVKALRNMTSNGQLPFYKLGRRNRYRKDELETLLDSKKRGLYGD